VVIDSYHDKRTAFIFTTTADGSQDFNDSLTDSVRNQVFDIPASDAFLIKATYRFVR